MTSIEAFKQDLKQAYADVMEARMSMQELLTYEEEIEKEMEREKELNEILNNAYGE